MTRQITPSCMNTAATPSPRALLTTAYRKYSTVVRLRLRQRNAHKRPITIGTSRKSEEMSTLAASPLI